MTNTAEFHACVLIPEIPEIPKIPAVYKYKPITELNVGYN